MAPGNLIQEPSALGTAGWQCGRGRAFCSNSLEFYMV